MDEVRSEQGFSLRSLVNGHVKMDTNGHEKSPRLAKK